MIDLVCSLLLAASLVVIGAAYFFRARVLGPAHHPRLDREGSSALLGKPAMEMGYWSLQPLGRLCIRLGVTANMVSWSALVLGAAAAAAVAGGHFGVGALLATLSSGCDVVDGMVARLAGSASKAGEVLDAALDRYVELLFLGGLVVHYRTEVPMVVLTLAALGGAFMVSYATVKAEALGIEVPRGSMRRVERAAYLVGAAALTPLAGVLWPAAPARLELPMRAAVVLVAAIANTSAIRRLRRLARAARQRSASRNEEIVQKRAPSSRAEVL